MQYLLTGNEDVDITIISSLKLEDIRNMCQSSTYATKLCNHLNKKFRKVDKKVNYILDLLNKRKNGLKFNTFDEYEKLNTFNEIIKRINDNVLIDDLTLDDYVTCIDIIYHCEKYCITFHLADIYICDQIELETSKSQLKEFLTHLYYNQLILF